MTNDDPRFVRVHFKFLIPNESLVPLDQPEALFPRHGAEISKGIVGLFKSFSSHMKTKIFPKRAEAGIKCPQRNKPTIG